MKKTAPPHITAFAACTFEIQADGSAIQLFPAGAFKARDGRPKDVASGHWYIDAAVAARVIAKAAMRQTDFVIDYEHQTLNTATNGEPAPAAGWFAGTTLEWREGLGLFASPVDWTKRGAAYIKAKEYRYLSPVFGYDRRTGEVLELLHVALTNDPALDGMDALAAARFDPATLAVPSTQEKQSVNREQLIALLGLSSDASEEDIDSALTGLKAEAGKVQGLTDALAAAKTANPDPSQYVPIAVVESMKGDIAALKSAQVGGEVDALVKSGIDDGRILPVQESWARELGTKDLVALKSYLEKTPAIAALKGQQTDGRTETKNALGLTDDELQAAALTGMSPEAYAATKGV